MNKFKEIKTMLTNKEVVTRYLGTPIKTTSTGIWYKSPFRSERTASFCASNKGIHDFGDSTHYDIISFVEKYFNTSANKALQILCYDFNISIGNEYETKEILANIKRKREEEQKAKELVVKWYNEKLSDICNKIQANNKCIEVCKEFHNLEVLKYLYDEQSKLEYQFELFTNANESDKIKLYLEAKK